MTVKEGCCEIRYLAFVAIKGRVHLKSLTVDYALLALSSRESGMH
jgi:hypothetical protein